MLTVSPSFLVFYLHFTSTSLQGTPSDIRTTPVIVSNVSNFAVNAGACEQLEDSRACVGVSKTDQAME